MLDQASRTIVVVGATGQQGSGTVDALLHHTEYQIVGLTRNPKSDAAVKLLNKAKEEHLPRLQLKAAELSDVESLKKAFEGAYGVFGVTQWQLPIKTPDDIRAEYVAGVNIVDAAKACGVKHLVFSSLPDIAKASGGKYKNVLHFDCKAQVEQYALEQLGSGVPTFLHAGLFYSNLEWSQYCKRAPDGVVEFRAPMHPDKKATWVDPAYDVGVFAAAAFARGPADTAGKTYPVHGPPYSQNELAATYQRIRGDPARAAPTTIEEWDDTVCEMVGPGFRDDIEEMIRWIDEAPGETHADYGTMPHEEYEKRKKELGGGTGSTFAQWLERTHWLKPGFVAKVV
ncbi:hypothetical protein JCM1840_000503 [Sporobolomyces johnsonii]